jgi:hypothetical protein
MRPLFRYKVECLLRVDADPDRNLRARLIVQLGVEDLTAVRVLDIPVRGSPARWNLLAALDLPLVDSIAAVVPAGVGTDRRACDSAAGGGDIPPATAAYLVAENAAYDASDNRARHIDIAPVAVDNLLAVYPAMRPRAGVIYTANRRHIGLVGKLRRSRTAHNHRQRGQQQTDTCR